LNNRGTKSTLRSLIEEHGGVVVENFGKGIVVNLFISLRSGYGKNTLKKDTAEKYGIPVVTEEWVRECVYEDKIVEWPFLEVPDQLFEMRDIFCESDRRRVHENVANSTKAQKETMIDIQTQIDTSQFFALPWVKKLIEDKVVHNQLLKSRFVFGINEHLLNVLRNSQPVNTVGVTLGTRIYDNDPWFKYSGFSVENIIDYLVHSSFLDSILGARIALLEGGDDVVDDDERQIELNLCIAFGTAFKQV
jgi:hypothetical protein